MRFLNKYKKLVKLDRFAFPQFSLRILKFQRPKWKKFQKQAIISKKSTCHFINPLILKNSYFKLSLNTNHGSGSSST